jgi:hypothetical protein
MEVMMPVTFTCREISPRNLPRVTEFRCNETGVCYQLETTPGGYVIRNSGKVVSHRTMREVAVAYIEQQAELDFRTAQADSASAGGE